MLGGGRTWAGEICTWEVAPPPVECRKDCGRASCSQPGSRKPWGGLQGWAPGGRMGGQSHRAGHTGGHHGVGTPVCAGRRLAAGAKGCCGPHRQPPPQTGGSEDLLLPGRYWESWTACFGLEFSEIILEKPMLLYQKNVCLCRKSSSPRVYVRRPPPSLNLSSHLLPGASRDSPWAGSGSHRRSRLEETGVSVAVGSTGLT